MNKKTIPQLLLRFIREKLWMIISFILTLCIVTGVLFLYDVHIEILSYIMVLVIVCLGIGLGFSFLNYKKRYEALLEVYVNLKTELYNLPEAGGLIEQGYQELLKTLEEGRTQLISHRDQEMADMLDYYTVWVHQVKTPIAALDLLLSAESLDRAQLKQELFKIQRYVDMVLGYLRTYSMNSDYRFTQVHLDRVVKQAVKKYAPVFIHQHIKVQLGNLDITILSDERWLEFVIEQLLSNALKYTPQKPDACISITLDTTREKRLIIQDNGIGIQAEDLPRVFERGFTGYNGHMDKKSTGLGLYLCKEIMDRLSHNIFITSEEGVGTRVFLDLNTIELHTE